MTINQGFGPAQSAAIYDACMIQLVTKDRVSLCSHGWNDAGVCSISWVENKADSVLWTLQYVPQAFYVAYCRRRAASTHRSLKHVFEENHKQLDNLRCPESPDNHLRKNWGTFLIYPDERAWGELREMIVRSRCFSSSSLSSFQTQIHISIFHMARWPVLFDLSEKRNFLCRL